MRAPLTALALLLAAACAPRVAAPPAAPEMTARTTALRTTLQGKLDSLRDAGRLPGATLGVALPDGQLLVIASGMSDTAARRAMHTHDRLLQGSVGKTYVSAVVLQLVHEGRIGLDDRIERYLGQEPWFTRLPNARTITVRHLLTHSSGLVRWEFQSAATKLFREQPMKVWTPEERLSYVFDLAPPFPAGEGWEYSDTNYIVLGMIIERVTGRPYYDELRRRILLPLALRNTIPSDRPDLDAVANGYAGPNNELGGFDASLVAGRLAVNPQLEWTGGGVASTADDLARWAKLLYEGRAFDPSLLPELVRGVPARLGRDVRYGLGVIIRPTALGESWGHSGFFPGYATDMAYFPSTKTAVALQINATNPYPRGMLAFLVDVAKTVRDQE